MNQKIKFGIILIIAVIYSCQREAFQFNPPVTYHNVGEMVVPGTTKILGTDELQRLRNVNQNELIFSNEGDLINQIKENDILMLGVSELTPYGLIVKITGIQDNGTEIIMTTVSATIAEAVKEGKIHLSKKLSGSEFTLVSTKKGVNGLKNNQAFDGIAVLLDHTELYRNNELEIIADGEITITPEVDFEIIISEHEILETRVQIMVKKVDELIISSNRAFNGQHKIVLATYIHSPIDIYGIIFTPLVSISAGFEGEVSGKVTTGVRQERLIAVDMLFKNGEWNTSVDHSKVTDFIEPELTTNANFKVWSGQQLDLMIFGITDPTYDVFGYQQLMANTNDADWWKLYIGIESSIGVSGNVIGLPTYTYNIDNIHSMLTSAGGAFVAK